MISDKEVKTQVSPFAVRENEVKVFDGKEGFASINQVVFKMDMGYINENHVKALEIVNEFGYITSRQVTQIMDYRGLLAEIDQGKRQDKVAKWLEDLAKSKVISRYYFQSDLGKSSYRAYCLDKIATYILKQRNIPTTWQPTDNVKPAFAIKRKLAGNQLIIAYMQKVASFADLSPNVLLYSKKYTVKFKPTGGFVKLLDGANEKNYIFEIVRRNSEWKEEFAKKLQLYGDFYESFQKNDGGFAEAPQLVFVGEDIEHVAEMFRVIKRVAFPLTDEKMYFTTDLRQLENSLERTISLFEFDKENQRYKVNTIDLPILKPGDGTTAKVNVSKDVKYTPNMIIE
ncbi:MAG: hypothetical protein RR922_00895 [Clostridia bacterium]